MNGEQKVQIPFELFHKISFLVDCLHLSNIELPAIYKLDEIRSELKKKTHSINLRTAYQKIIYANDESQKNFAIMQYSNMKKKNPHFL